jgi:ATP-dependent helicase/nuclease subunit B
VFAPPAARNPLIWARAIEAAPKGPRMTAPAPKPPADDRPKRISFTGVETLIRDPYAVYARRVLGLDVLDPPGSEPSHRERGTAIHGALEHFADGDDVHALMALIDRNLAAAGFDAARRAVEQGRLWGAAQAYVAWNSARRAAGVVAVRETLGELDLGGGHKLVGRADRIDILPHGGLEVIDFKTGSVPSAGQVESGLSPQLTLEGAVAARGAFENVPAAPVVALAHWRFAGSNVGDQGPSLKSKGVADACEEALARLKTLLARYDEPAQAYYSKPRVQFAKPYADYDHFARRAEWADVEGDEE